MYFGCRGYDHTLLHSNHLTPSNLPDTLICHITCVGILYTSLSSLVTCVGVRMKPQWSMLASVPWKNSYIARNQNIAYQSGGNKENRGYVTLAY